MGKSFGRLGSILLFSAGIPVGIALGLAFVVSMGTRGGALPAAQTEVSSPRFVPLGDGRSEILRPVKTLAFPSDPPLPSVAELERVEASLADVLPAARAATVVVEARGFDRYARTRHEMAVGTGVIVSPDGLVLTAGHVIGQPGRKFLIKLADGREVNGQTLGLSLWSDSGMIQIQQDGDYPFVALAPPDKVPLAGDWCFGIGHPGGPDGFGTQPAGGHGTTGRGEVLRIGRVIEGSLFTIQTTCKLLGGDSGGPLFNLDGEVIGIHSRISPDVVDNFHVPTTAFHRRWDALLAGKSLGDPGGWLGVECDGGTTITSVVGASAAEEADIRVGDVVVHVNGVPVETRSFDEFDALIREYDAGDSIALGVQRGTEELLVNVTLGQPPSGVSE